MSTFAGKRCNRNAKRLITWRAICCLFGGAFLWSAGNHGNATSRHETGKLKFMAQVLGESGRFASQEAVRKQRALWKLVMLFMGLDGFIVGFLIRGPFPRLTITSGTGLLASLVLVLLMWGAGAWTFRKLDELDKVRANWQKGAGGEVLVARELGKFPEELKVTNDGLARLDKDFTEKAGGNGRPRISAIVQTRGDKTNPPRASLTPRSTWPGTVGRSRTPS